MAIDRPRRRFDGYDAAALVAATALGLVMAREIHEQYTSTMFDGGRHNPDGLRLWRYVSVPLFAAWTLALVPLQFRGPGWLPRLLARRPGLVAGVAVAFQVIRAGAEQATWLILHHRKSGIRLQWFGWCLRVAERDKSLVHTTLSTGTGTSLRQDEASP